MKKFFTLIAAALISAAAFADSYTITFGGEGTGALKVGTTELSAFISGGAEYVSGFNYVNAEIAGEPATTTNVNLGDMAAGNGLRVGSSNGTAANLQLLLSGKGAVKATSIVINAAVKSATPTAIINGQSKAVSGETFADYTFTLDGSQISAISVESAGGQYNLKSITVNYEAAQFDATLCHSPRYSEGKVFEAVLGPNLIANKTKEGAVKPGIADYYAWVQYVNPTSTLDDGTGEVQQSNRWTNYDPSYADWNYGEGANWIQVKGDNGSVNSPVISSAWGKYMVFYVKDTKKISILGIGSASGSAADGNCIKAVAVSSEGDVIEKASEAGKIYGKGTASDVLDIDLDPAKSYMITIKGDETAQKDIQIGGLQLWGTSEVVGPAVKPAAPSFQYFDVILGPDMIDATKTKEGVAKPGISDDYKWIVYVNPTSTLDDGTAEVQQSNRWTDLDPRTGVKGEWIQVTGKNGSVNSPVLAPAYGKYMKFYVSGTKKFTVYGAGSASGSAADNNCIKVTAVPFNSSNVVEATSTPGAIYGKGTASDLVSVELVEAEKYEVIVEAAVKDIQITGINLLNAEGEANKEANKGTLNIALEKAADGAEIDLGGEEWTLNGPAAINQNAVVVKNGTITADATGQIVAKKSITLDGVKMTSTVAPVVLANKDALTAADTTKLASWKVVPVPAVLYTQEEADAYNEENGLVEGDEGSVKAGDVKEAATTKDEMIFPNASNKVFIADLISIVNSEIKTASSFVSGGNAPWALRTLNVDNSIIETTTGSGKAFLDWEQGASQIKDIVIKNSTLYSTVENSEQRFHRYSAQVDPWRVWGYTGTDKNEPGLNTWVLTNNTIVNLCGNKEFSNNMKNTAATTFDFKGNIFANTWRLQKLGTNCKRLFAKEDNVICGGVNAVDGTDANWCTVDAELGICVNDSVVNFTPDVYYSLAAVKGYGDPRNLKAHVDLVPAGSYFATATITPADGVTVPASLQKYVAEGYETTFTVDAEGNITAGEGLLAGAQIAVNKIGYTADTQFTIEGQTVSLGAEAGSLKLTQVENGVQVADFDIYKAGIKVGTVTNFVITTVSTGIKNVESAAAVKSVNAKFIENGRVVIVKNGAKFNVAGQVIK